MSRGLLRSAAFLGPALDRERPPEALGMRAERDGSPGTAWSKGTVSFFCWDKPPLRNRAARLRYRSESGDRLEGGVADAAANRASTAGPTDAEEHRGESCAARQMVSAGGYPIFSKAGGEGERDVMGG